MTSISSGLEGHSSSTGHWHIAIPGIERLLRRFRALSRLRRRHAHLAIIAFSHDERLLADIGLATRRQRYDWIGQVARALASR